MYFRKFDKQNFDEFLFMRVKINYCGIITLIHLVARYVVLCGKTTFLFFFCGGGKFATMKNGKKAVWPSKTSREG